MTSIYLREIPASELKLGDQFVWWAFPKDKVFGEAERILDMKKGKAGLLRVITPDHVYDLHPEHLVIIQEAA